MRDKFQYLNINFLHIINEFIANSNKRQKPWNRYFSNFILIFFNGQNKMSSMQEESVKHNQNPCFYNQPELLRQRISG